MRPCRATVAFAILACILTACATPGGTDRPPTGSDARDPGRVAIVAARFQPDYVFESRIAAKSDQAAWGAFLGGGQCVATLGAGVLAAPFFLLCATIASASAAIGAASTPGPPSAARLDAAQSQGQRALDALNLQDSARQAMLGYAKAEGIDLADLDIPGPLKPEDLPSYDEAGKGADTVIEVSVLSLGANAFEMGGKPHIGVSLRARARILSVRDGKQIDMTLFSVGGGIRTLDQWFALESADRTGAFEAATREIAERAIDELLLVYRPRETSQSAAPGEREPVPAFALRALEPPIRKSFFGEGFGLAPVAVNSLQPEFRWEAWPRGFAMVPGDGPEQAQDVEYHLRIYGAEGLAYERRGLSQPVHRLEKALQPCSRYRWTVRAHFSFHGTPRVTEWTGAYATALGTVDPRWIRRKGSAPSLALVPGSLFDAFPLIETPGANGKACPSR